MIHNRVLFRADASQTIGSGHVMRCLTLADALRARRVESVFACAPLAEGLAQRIVDRGHVLIDLPAGKTPIGEPETEATWPADLQDRDARLTAAATAEHDFDWAVVDHYGLDRTWQGIVRGHAGHVMVIDDLANRTHDCDLLLDQNLGRTPSDYHGLVNPKVQVLAGPEFALLRPEFARRRAAQPPRTDTPRTFRIIVSFGGADPSNHTGRVLEQLRDLDLPHSTEIKVVLGSLAHYTDEVHAMARTMPKSTEVLSDVSDMASLMSQCDLAIGAAGATAWERCCMGLPSLVMVIAENQRPGAVALVGAGAAISATVLSLREFDFPGFFDSTRGPSRFIEMSRRASALCDGLGTSRVCEALNV